MPPPPNLRPCRRRAAPRMADISGLMAELSSVTDQKVKLERYKAVLQDYVAPAGACGARFQGGAPN